MTKIDINKPLQLTDGTPVTYLKASYMTNGGYTVRIEKNSNARKEGQHRHFKSNGTHIHGTLPDLQNVPEVTKIDFTKPLEDLQGNALTYNDKAKYVQRVDGGEIACGKNLRYRTVYIDPARADLGWSGFEPFIRNVTPQGTLDTSKPLQTRSGAPVQFVGKLEDGRLVIFRDTYEGRETRVIAANGRVHSHPQTESTEDIINKPEVPVVTYRNVYADGTSGVTPHKTLEAALAASKYDKVRVGVLRQEHLNGKLVKAAMHSTYAVKRTRAYPKGSPNPWA